MIYAFHTGRIHQLSEPGGDHGRQLTGSISHRCNHKTKLDLEIAEVLAPAKKRSRFKALAESIKAGLQVPKLIPTDS